MAARRIAWVLNLDADVELAAIARGGAGGASSASRASAYAPKRGVVEAMHAYVPVVASSLLGPEDVLVTEDTPPLSLRGFTGRAFCPTPRALRLLERAAAEPEASPAAPVLCLVNSRAFASALGVTLPDAAFVTELDAARARLLSAPALGDGWRIKRAFGMAGRGQRVVAAGPPSESDLAFVRAGLEEGGVQIEPNVVIVRELAIHGMLAASDGLLRLGAVVQQRCDARGAWIATEPLAPNDDGGIDDVVRHLEAEARRVGSALSSAGYFGPFGIDAFSYRDQAGALRLQPRSEINARYSMGFAIGFKAR